MRAKRFHLNWKGDCLSWETNHLCIEIRSCNKIFIRILFTFSSFYVNLIEWIFYSFLMCRCESNTLCVIGTVQFTFFLVMRLNITIITSWDLVIVILVPYTFFIIKAWKWIEETHPKHHWNKIRICQISCHFFLFFTGCYYVIPSFI